MFKTKTHKYIFEEESSFLFYDKVECLHNYFLESLLLSGKANNGSSILSINFKENEKFGKDFLNLIKNAVDLQDPFLRAMLINEGRLEIECLFYNFGEKNGVNYIYMIQNLMDWESEEDFCCQVWSLIEPTQQLIENFWKS